MKKVYCGDCKWFRRHMYTDNECANKKKWIPYDRPENIHYTTACCVLNKNNNCKQYKEPEPVNLDWIGPFGFGFVVGFILMAIFFMVFIIPKYYGG